jgi:hypothetical protein
MTFQEVVRALQEGHVPKTALNGKKPRYSASTVKTMKVCPRKHFFEQVVGIDPPIGPALGFGTKVHGFIERYLKKGEIPRTAPHVSPEERCAAKGIHLLPAHGTPGMVIEEPFSMPTWPGGPMFTGTADLFIEPEGYDPAEHAAGVYDDAPLELADLFDHKTTGNYRRYSQMGWALSCDSLKKPGENTKRVFLSDDEQNISYATMMLRRYPVKFVRSTWVYYPKDTSPAETARATMEREETKEKWRTKVLPLLGGMHDQHQTRPSLATVEANEDACDSFGGCPHRSYCVDYKGKTVMGKLSEELKRGHGAAKETKELPAKEKEPVKETKSAKADAAPSINPPKKKLVDESLSPFKTMDEEKDAAPAAAPNRGKLADSVKKETAKEEADTYEEKHAKKEKLAASTAAAPAPIGAGFALFLGSYPAVSKRPVVELAKILAPLEERVAKANKVAHVGLVKYDAAHHTAAALEEWVTENGEQLDGTNVVVGKSPFHQDVAERVLWKRASAVSVGL